VTSNAVSAAVSSIDSFFDALQDEDVPQPWTTPGPVAQRPPRLLLTLLGDYWWQRTESLPSAAIVGLLAEFGVSDSAARAALSRLTRNGLLVTSRSGRRTFVRLSRRAADVRSRSLKTTGPPATSSARSCAGSASRRSTTGSGSARATTRAT
jgi:DNA-binding transcriptional ArsR family regulator